MTQAPALLNNSIGSIVRGDKGYSRGVFVDERQGKKCTVVIPSRRNAKVHRYDDKHNYKG